MLDKVLAGTLGRGQPDVVTLDLEDSVRTENKGEARRMVTRCALELLTACSGCPATSDD